MTRNHVPDSKHVPKQTNPREVRQERRGVVTDESAAKGQRSPATITARAGAKVVAGSHRTFDRRKFTSTVCAVRI